MKKATLITVGLYGITLYSLLYASYLETKQVVMKEKINTLEARLYKFTKDKYIAEVLSKSKYPYTLAAIAKIESDFRPQIHGDSGESIGLYQIQPKHWGKVPDSIEEQTKKAESILAYHIKKHGYKEAIKRWNGTGPQATAYQKRVLLAMKSI